MRTTEQIAAEALRRTGDTLSGRTIIMAIELAYDEMLRIMFPLTSESLSESDAPRVYVLTGTPWNDLVKYVRNVERQGVVCTNSGFNNWTQEIDNAEFVIALRGWNETKQGREKGAYIKSKGKEIKHYKTFIYETRGKQHTA